MRVMLQMVISDDKTKVLVDRLYIATRPLYNMINRHSGKEEGVSSTTFNPQISMYLSLTAVKGKGRFLKISISSIKAWCYILHATLSLLTRNKIPFKSEVLRELFEDSERIPGSSHIDQIDASSSSSSAHASTTENEQNNLTQSSLKAFVKLCELRVRHNMLFATSSRTLEEIETLQMKELNETVTSFANHQYDLLMSESSARDQCLLTYFMNGGTFESVLECVVNTMRSSPLEAVNSTEFDWYMIL